MTKSKKDKTAKKTNAVAQRLAQKTIDLVVRVGDRLEAGAAAAEASHAADAMHAAEASQGAEAIQVVRVAKPETIPPPVATSRAAPVPIAPVASPPPAPAAVVAAPSPPAPPPVVAAPSPASPSRLFLPAPAAVLDADRADRGPQVEAVPASPVVAVAVVSVLSVAPVVTAVEDFARAMEAIEAYATQHNLSEVDMPARATLVDVLKAGMARHGATFTEGHVQALLDEQMRSHLRTLSGRPSVVTGLPARS